MNLKHLGDALDHWKGSMLQCLQDALHSVCVLPMFTDPTPWSQDNLRVYARLLRVDVARVLQPTTPFDAHIRSRYFSDLSLSCDSDLFVDPDTGVAERSSSAKHITPAEIGTLFPSGCSRVLLVYQHAPRRKVHVADCLRPILNCPQVGACSGFAYDAGSASMLFVSRNDARLAHVRAALVKRLWNVQRVCEIEAAPPSLP